MSGGQDLGFFLLEFLSFFKHHSSCLAFPDSGIEIGREGTGQPDRHIQRDEAKAVGTVSMFLVVHHHNPEYERGE